MIWESEKPSNYCLIPIKLKQDSSTFKEMKQALLLPWRCLCLATLTSDRSTRYNQSVRDKRKTEHLRPDRRELKSEDSMASFPCDEATLTRQLREASSYRRDSIMSTHTLWLTWPLPSVSQLHMKTWNIANETTGESKQLRGLRATE